MKLKNGKLKMSHKERMRMWTSILKDMQRDSVGDFISTYGICNYISAYLLEHLICLSVTGASKYFPELLKYKPTSASIFWWGSVISVPQEWYAPRIECVNNILNDLKYKNFPQYHDKFIFPSRWSSCTWQYLSNKEREECYVYFSGTVHYAFWKSNQAWKALLQEIKRVFAPVFLPIFNKLNNLISKTK